MTLSQNFPGGSVVKSLPTVAGDTGSIPGLGRSPGEGNGNPLQYPCMGNAMDRGALWNTVHGVTKEQDTTKQLNNSLEHSPKCWGSKFHRKCEPDTQENLNSNQAPEVPNTGEQKVTQL